MKRPGVEHEPDGVAAHLAYCELVLGRVSEARQHADSALALNPGT